MKKWEYKTQYIPDIKNEGYELDMEVLNGLGEEGWEVITQVHTGQGNRYLMMRPVPGPNIFDSIRSALDEGLVPDVKYQVPVEPDAKRFLGLTVQEAGSRVAVLTPGQTRPIFYHYEPDSYAEYADRHSDSIIMSLDET